MQVKRIFGFVIFSTILVNCVQPEKSEVEAVVRGIIVADNNNDIEAVLSSYAKEAVLFPPKGDVIIGEAAIRKNYEDIFATTQLRLSISIDHSQIIDDKLAWCVGNTTGETTSLADGSIKKINDRYFMTLQKVDDRWKILSLKWGF
ncbi:MAG: SgcJ/EcaC family oxidoreductase [Cyclobacteriaceae bacterium]|nr:SgcJ/EcaC family oxidoreductase [Cyclobacteriaceae bacterium]